MRTCSSQPRRFRRTLWLAVVAILWTAPAWSATVSTSIQGIDDKEALRNVEISLAIKQASGERKLAPDDIRRMHEEAPLQIRRALEPFGYYHPTIDATLTERKNDRFQARYVVHAGLPVRLDRVDVTVAGAGRNREPFRTLVADFALHRGDVLHEGAYGALKSSLATAAADSGYLDAQFETNTILIDKDRNRADISLHFDTGPRYLFGPVQFDSSGVDERVLRSYLTFHQGEPFRYDKLLAFQSALGGTPYFNRVEAAPRRDMATGLEVPIIVHLTPRRPRRYEVGAGYGTDTGPRARFDTEFRLLNHAGHRFDGRVNWSEIELSLNAEYFIPSRYPQKHAYSFGSEIAKLDPVAYTTNRVAVGATRSQPRFGWLESLRLSYEREDYTVGLDNGITDLVIAGVQYRRKRADDETFPRHGYRMGAGLRGSHSGMLSSQSFLSFTLDAKTVQSAGRYRFLGRAEGGRTLTSTFRNLPPTIRFFAGGDNSIRGYDYESLGPTDADGNVIGGDYLLVASIELEAALFGKFAAAAFIDAGNAFQALDRGQVEEGVGGGLRWRSPVGPIRVDLAFPVDHDGWKLHVTMGPDL